MGTYAKGAIQTKVGNSLFDRRAMVVIKTAIDNRCFTEL